MSRTLPPQGPDLGQATNDSPPSCGLGREGTEDSFTLRWYLQALAMLLGSPGRFFRGLSEGQDVQRPAGFLLVSALVHTIAHSHFETGVRQPNEPFEVNEVHTIAHSHFETGPPWVGFVLTLANALGMTVFSALIAFTISRMTSSQEVRCSTVFSVFAYASGVTLLASWVPMLVWVTEPWKWFLITIGLVHGAGLRWPRALGVVVATIVVVIVFFWSLGEFIASRKGGTSG